MVCDPRLMCSILLLENEASGILVMVHVASDEHPARLYGAVAHEDGRYVAICGDPQNQGHGAPSRRINGCFIVQGTLG